MIRRSPLQAWLSRAPWAAAFLGLALQLMFPAGFMAGTPDSGHGLSIVICTAQGQIVTDWDSLSGHKPKAPAKGMASCPFAGHATASGPPAPLSAAARVVFAPAAQPLKLSCVAPGRGLAAPPPASTGPPTPPLTA